MVPPETIPGPVQLKVVPNSVLAESVIHVVVHVSVPPVALAPGVTRLSFTEAVAVLVHPLAELVTVTVKVPVELTFGFALVAAETIPAPAQLKPVPDVEVAERTTQVVVHVRVPPVALAPGATRLSFTSTVAELEQPVEVLVTVTVKVPVELTLGLAVVSPEIIPVPTQVNVVPYVGPADRTTDVVVQVNVPPVTVGVGGVLVNPTGADAVLVHPVTPSVTVTVYVPEVPTVGFGVVPFVMAPGPAQL